MVSRTQAMSIAFFSLAVSAMADVDYMVTLRPEQRMQIAVTIPVRSAVTQVQIPNWAPGSYVLVDNWKRIEDFKVVDDKGNAITPVKPNDYTWTIPSNGMKSVTVTYTEPVAITEEIGHYSGPSNYIYVVDRKNEACHLTLDMPQGWNAALGLDMKGGSYYANTYDVLADNPVTFGKYRQLEYTVLGKPHIIALYGAARNDLDDQKLVDACRFIAAAENDFFGNKPPYSHYVWHFNVGRRPDGGGGLEHLASTEITLANGLGPGIIGVNAHEFFHLWNVKRIRSRVLGPFDYTKLPETGALWWLEGVTEYYAHQLMTRYGYWDDAKLYATIVRNVQNVRNNKFRLEVSPYEASFRVKDANNGRGNSNGYQISYYDLGFVLGLVLDCEMLARTSGKYSLDDVERALWNMTKNDQPGFNEGEIRNQLVKFGGAGMGDYYDRVVMRPGELPVEDALAKVGLQLVTENRTYPDLGFTFGRGSGGFGGALRVGRVTGPAEGKLKADDELVEINGNPVPTMSGYNAVLAKINPGDVVTLKVKTGADTHDVQITAASVTRPATEVRAAANVDSKTAALRELYLHRRKNGWKAPSK